MVSGDQSLVLVTGANGGIGFELAAQLLADLSQLVLLGSRSIEKGEAAVNDLKAHKLPGSVELLHIDVDSEKSVTEAAKEVVEKYGRIDVLVNNPAIASREDSASLSHRLTVSFLTNATGPTIVIEAFASLLAKSSKTPQIVTMPSESGSIGLRLDYSNLH